MGRDFGCDDGHGVEMVREGGVQKVLGDSWREISSKIIFLLQRDIPCIQELMASQSHFPIIFFNGKIVGVVGGDVGRWRNTVDEILL